MGDHISSVASDACKKAKAGSSLMGPCKSAMKAALNAACKAAMKNGGPISEHTCVHDAGCHARLMGTTNVFVEDSHINASSLPAGAENVSLQLSTQRRRRKLFHEVEHKVEHGVDKGAEEAWKAAKCPLVDLGCKEGVKALDKYGDKQCEADHVSSVASEACQKAKAGSLMGPCKSAMKSALNAACKTAMKNGGPISEHTCVHGAGCHARLLATTNDNLNINASFENVSLQLGHRRRKLFHEVEHGVEHGVDKVDKDAEKVWNKAKCPIFKKACKSLFARAMTKQSECVEAAAEAVGECEAAGGGPEDPAADACSAAMSGTVEAACALAVKDGKEFGVHECEKVLGC